MGSDVLQFFTPLSPPLRPKHPLNSCNSTISTSNPTRCFSTSSGDRRGGGARWRPREYERFSWDDEELRANDKEVEFGFAARQRIWWSDEVEDEDEEEEAGFDDFRVMESSISFAWVMKVLRAFGWMVPAVVMYAVLGTGTNNIIMALALPLAQSALSLVMDAISGWSDEGPRSKSKKKKRYARATDDPGIRSRKGQNTRNSQGVGDYQSWVAPNGASNRKQSQSTQAFGGWDELDNHRMEGQLKKPRTQRSKEPRQWTNVKVNKRIGKSETPLLLRLLIAAFPFLGSWTKLL